MLKESRIWGKFILWQSDYVGRIICLHASFPHTVLHVIFHYPKHFKKCKMRHLSPTFFFIYNFSLAKSTRYLITLTNVQVCMCMWKEASSFLRQLFVERRAARMCEAPKYVSNGQNFISVSKYFCCDYTKLQNRSKMKTRHNHWSWTGRLESI